MNPVLDTGVLPDDWSDAQNALFTKVYKFMIANQDAMCHPASKSMPIEYWQTVAHNSAWIAAELAESDSVRILDVDTEQTIAESPGSLNS